jgi:hypothetical protein
LIYEVLRKNCREEFKFHYNLTTITNTLLEDKFTFLALSHSVFHRTRNVSDKSRTVNHNTHFALSNFFLVENLVVSEIMWKKYGTAGVFVCGSLASGCCLSVYSDKDSDSWERVGAIMEVDFIANRKHVNK